MPLCPDPHHLAYTVAFDPPGSPGHSSMAKMLASSLLRTYFGGDIIVFRNSPEPLFRVERKGLEEIYIETPQLGGLAGAEDAWCWKYRVREHIDAEKYDKILFLDADCLALRNLDHLLEGDWDLAYQTEKGLNISLPRLSVVVRDREIRVGYSLCKRGKAGFQLTDEGIGLHLLRALEGQVGDAGLSSTIRACVASCSCTRQGKPCALPCSVWGAASGCGASATTPSGVARRACAMRLE